MEIYAQQRKNKDERKDGKMRRRHGKRHTQKMNISSSIYHEILGVGLRIERKGWEK